MCELDVGLEQKPLRPRERRPRDVDDARDEAIALCDPGRGRLAREHTSR